MSSVVGRDHEIAAIEAFLAAPATGLVIVGEPGIGKTTVWRESVRLARDRGFTVLIAGPAESEEKLSFAGLSDLLSDITDAAGAALPPPQRDALDVALLRTPAPRPPERRLLGTAFASLLRALATESDVIVAIDDLQWLDAPSAAVVEFALRRAPVRALFAIRTSSPSPLLDLQTHRVSLGPVSVAALHRILTERLGRSFPRPTLVRIADASAGNPFYALEIARLVAESSASSALPVPSDVLELIRGRIGSLPAESRDALLLVAAAARPELRMVDPAALAAAEDAGLVHVATDGTIAFTHPLYASAVYNAAPIARRRAAHRALAAAVDNPEESARHLALASSDPDEHVASAVEQAARAARARGAADTAIELAEHALRLTPGESPLLDVRRLDLATFLELGGELERATALLEELSNAAEDDDLRARALLRLSDLVYRRSGETEASAVVRRALAAARDATLRAHCEATLAVWAGTVDVTAATAAARAAVDALEGTDAEPGLQSFALASLVRAKLFAGEGFDRAAAQRALELQFPSPPPAVDDRLVFKLGQWLRYIDDFPGARQRLGEAQRAAKDEGDEPSLVNIVLNQLVLEMWAGNPRPAKEHAAQLAILGDQLDVRHAARDWQTYLDAQLGRLDAVREAALAADRTQPITDMLYLRALGAVELAAGLPEDANAHLTQALVVIEQAGFREPAIWRVEGDAVEAAVAVGELDRAELLVAGFEQQAAQSKIPWSLAVSARCRGLVLAARGNVEEAALALAAQHDCPMPVERARTLLALGRVQRRLKQKRLARESFEAALAIFDEVESVLWAERTREELARVTTRKAPATLTATEREIAHLAAEGLSNRAIAERVHVSQKTVEANLARAYRKLAITSRAQLSRALDQAIS